MGFKGMLPITTGVIPFGAVVGTICNESGISFFQTMTMNILVFAGAAQLGAMELMQNHAAAIIVVITGLVINLRFLLYSAALSPVLQKSRFITKLAVAYTLTDQSYAVMSANENKLKTEADHVEFYLGTAACMYIVWQLAVVAGFIFGNFAPASWALDYAVPISFVALVIPTLKNRNYIIVAIFSSVASVMLNPLPYKLGLICTAALAITLAAYLTQKRAKV